jgi:ABC-type glycerol-3-phosphate transport system permease component
MQDAYAALNTVGLPGQEWLKDPQLALPALIVMLIWAGLGWDALIITAGLRSIPDDLYDAAKVDGSSGWDEFWHITIPLLQPTILFVTVTSIIFLWGMFAQPQLYRWRLVRRTQTIAMYLYDTGFQYHKFGYALGDCCYLVPADVYIKLSELQVRQNRCGILGVGGWAMRRRRAILTTGIAGFLILFAILYLIPYLWMISLSIKPDSEIFSRNLIPAAPTLEQYRRLVFGYQFQDIILKIDYGRFYLNTAFVTIASLILVLFTDALAAYTFAKFQFKGKTVLFWTNDSHDAPADLCHADPELLALLQVETDQFVCGTDYAGRGRRLWHFPPQAVYGDDPNELLDAAKVDGAGAFRRFWQIVVPLSRPALGTLAIFRFLGVWNDYLWPLVVIRQQDMYTLTLGIASMEIRQGLVVTGSQMAASVLATLPVLILVFLAQRQFLRGLTVGAFKT